MICVCGTSQARNERKLAATQWASKPLLTDARADMVGADSDARLILPSDCRVVMLSRR